MALVHVVTLEQSPDSSMLLNVAPYRLSTCGDSVDLKSMEKDDRSQKNK